MSLVIKNKFSSGFAALMPILIVVAIFVVVLSLKSNGRLSSAPANKTSVLSESTEEDVSDSDEEDEEDVDSPRPVRSPSRQNPRTSQEQDEDEEIEMDEAEDETEDPGDAEDSETEVEIETEVRDGASSARIKIQQNGRSFQFEQEASAVTMENDLPISVDEETGELTITTRSGSRAVTVLPDTAATNILDSGVLSRLDQDEDGRNQIEIITSPDGEPIYELRGVDVQRLLGIFNVAISKTAHISLRSGQIENIEQDLFSRILDAISF